MNFGIQKSRCENCGEHRTDKVSRGKVTHGECRCTLSKAEWERRREAEETSKRRELEDELSKKRAEKDSRVARGCWEDSGQFCIRHPDDHFPFCAVCPGVLKKTSKRGRLESTFS